MPDIHPADNHPDLLVKDADARLIAAAPELLEALKDARETLDIGGARYVYGADAAMRLIAKCDAAIAKATGGEE